MFERAARVAEKLAAKSGGKQASFCRFAVVRDCGGCARRTRVECQHPTHGGPVTLHFCQSVCRLRRPPQERGHSGAAGRLPGENALAKTALLLPWGQKGAMEGLQVSLRRLGYQVAVVPRGTRTWRDDVLQAIRQAPPGGARLCATWQRLYPGWGEQVRQALDAAGFRMLILDFGVWPHYASALADPQGDNATSSLVGALDRLEADAFLRRAADRHEGQVDEMARTLRERAALADRRRAQLGLEGLPEGFVFLCLQRTGDSVLRYDAPARYRTPRLVLTEALEQAQRSGRYLVVKSHPLDNELAIADDELQGANHRILAHQALGAAGAGANEQALAWLLAHCERMVTVNSTVQFQALALGTPVYMLGRGWASGNAVVHECGSMAAAFGEAPAVDRRRGRRFLAHLLSRQLPLAAWSDPFRVAEVLSVLGIQRT